MPSMPRVIPLTLTLTLGLALALGGQALAFDDRNMPDGRVYNGTQSKQSPSLPSVWVEDFWPKLEMKSGEEPDPKRGRFVAVVEGKWGAKSLVDLFSGERWWIPESDDAPAIGRPVWRPDGWTYNIVRTAYANTHQLWSCEQSCSGTPEPGSSDRIAVNSQGQRIHLGSVPMPLRFKGEALRIQRAWPDEPAIEKIWALQAESEGGQVLWRSVFLGQTVGQRLGPRDELGMDSPICLLDADAIVFPGLDWFFVRADCGDGASQNRYLARIELKTGRLLAPHPLLKVVPAAELESLVQRVLAPLERNAGYQRKYMYLSDGPGEPKLWKTTDDPGDPTYARVFGAFRKQYFSNRMTSKRHVH